RKPNRRLLLSDNLYFHLENLIEGRAYRFSAQISTHIFFNSLPYRLQLTYGIVHGIGKIDLAIGIDGDALWECELGLGAGAPFSVVAFHPGGGARRDDSLGCDFAHAMIVAVRDVEIAMRVHSNGVRIGKPGGRGVAAVAGESRR